MDDWSGEVPWRTGLPQELTSMSPAMGATAEDGPPLREKTAELLLRPCQSGDSACGAFRFSVALILSR